MPVLRPACLLLALVAAAAGCSSTTPKYLRAPSLAEPTPAPQDSRNAYLELIQRMQQQGAWYASLAHVDAFRQRYGDTPALRCCRRTHCARPARSMRRWRCTANSAMAPRPRPPRMASA